MDKNPRSKTVYILFNKPYGVLTQFSDKVGRQTLADYIPVKNVYPAGRLDMDSEGLVLLTNDGTLNHKITTPRTHLDKVYYVQVEGKPDEDDLIQLRAGVLIKSHTTLPCQANVIPDPKFPVRNKPVVVKRDASWLRIVLWEGKKRQIRHMTAAIGFPTLRIVRTAIGSLTIEGLKPGQWRYLSEEEVNMLRKN